MFDSREPQRVQFLPLVVCGLSHLPQLPLQAAVAFQSLLIVAVELHQLVILGGQGGVTSILWTGLASMRSAGGKHHVFEEGSKPDSAGLSVH